MDRAIALIGVTIAVLGLSFTLWRFMRERRLHDQRQKELAQLIIAANYVASEHELVRSATESLDRELAETLIRNDQEACSVYKQIVGIYLSQEREFTFARLEKIRKTNLVGGQWQENHWRSLIVQRKENAADELPDLASDYQPSLRAQHTTGRPKASVDVTTIAPG